MATNAVTLKLLADTKGIREGINQTNDQLSGLQSGLSKTTSFVKNLAVGFVAFKAVGAITDSFKEAGKAVQEQEKLLAQTNAVLKSTGAAAGVTADGVLSLSDAIEKKSLIDAEQIQSAQNMLLTFTNVKNGVGAGNDIFNQATQTIADMSTALGQDTSASAVQLGKALNDPIKGVTALSKIGVSFTAEQKEQIKTLVESGDTMGAQKIILGELSKEFGGSAAAAGDTFAGKIKHLKDMWDGFVETLVKKALPIITKVADYIVTNVVPAIQTVAQWIGDNVVPALKDFGQWVQKNSTWLGALGSAFLTIGAAILAYQTYLSIVSGVTKAYIAIQTAFNAVMAINPFVLILVGIIALAAAFVYLWTHSETFRNIIIGVFDAVKNAVTAVKDWFVARFNDIVNFVRAVPGKITGFFSAIGSFFSNIWSGIKNGAVNGWNAVVGFVRGVPGMVMGAIGNLGSTLVNAGGDLLRGLWNGIQAVSGWLKNKIIGFFGRLVPGWVKDVFGINSPSKVFAEFGKYLTQGLAVGITDSSAMRQVRKATDSLSTSVTGAFGTPQLAMAGSGAGGTTVINQNFHVAPTADQASLGREIEKARQAWLRTNGR